MLTQAVRLLTQERQALHQRIKLINEALQGLHGLNGPTNGRPKRRFSLATRRKMAKAQRARWAKK